MITIVENGDIFNSKMQTITNTINCVGAMGKGIALEFKKRFPDYYKTYREKCEQAEVDVGNVYLYKKSNPWILSFPTKTHWRWPSKMEYIEQGLDDFVKMYSEYGVTSIAFPALGCTNGGLEWEDVKKVIIDKLNNLPIEIELYAPRN